MPSSVAFVFPGQGSQRVGMLDSLPLGDDTTRLLDAAEALSGFDLRRIAAEGPDTALADTRVAQPLLYLAGWSWARALIGRDVAPVAVAGHSLGELVALAVAGVYSVEAGLELVCERGRLMALAAEHTPGTMAAVLGTDADEIGDLIAGINGVWVANDNCPGQTVISGTHAGVESATAALLGAGARKVVPLAVAGPFHSPLMAPAADAFGMLLTGVDFTDAAIPVVQNTLPEPATGAETLRERLVAQIVSPVRWTETLGSLRSMGVDLLVETGPGAVLTGLARRIEGVDAVSAETVGIAHIVEVTAA